MNSLPILIVNPYNRCNCRCVMCEIWKRDTPREISFEAFEKQLPALQAMRVSRVVFSGGEPLMHPHLFRFCRALRDRDIPITLLSSGLLLERHADSIAEFIGDVIVSLDGPPEIHNSIRRISNAYELLKRGVARLRALRPNLPIAARCTVQLQNCRHLTDTVDTALALYLDSISFLAADIHSTAFNRSGPIQVIEHADGIALMRHDLPPLEAQIDALIETGQCSAFIVESPPKLRKIAHHFRCCLGLAEPVSPVCNAPWNSAVMESDGSVRPCFFHEPVGRITPDIDILQVLESPRAAGFRATLDIPTNPICRRCVCSLNWKESGS